MLWCLVKAFVLVLESRSQAWKWKNAPGCGVYLKEYIAVEEEISGKRFILETRKWQPIFFNSLNAWISVSCIQQSPEVGGWLSTRTSQSKQHFTASDCSCCVVRNCLDFQRCHPVMVLVVMTLLIVGYIESSIEGVLLLDECVGLGLIYCIQ